MAPQRPEGRPQVERWFYIGFALFIFLLSVARFGPSIIDQSRRNAPPTLLVGAHGIVTAGWLLLFLTQATLVATRRTAVHRRLGIVRPCTRSCVAIIEFGRRGYDLSGDVIRALSRTGSLRRDPAGLLFPLAGLLNFGILVAAGLWYRHRPDIHKRLMLLSLVPLAGEPIIHLVGTSQTTGQLSGAQVSRLARPSLSSSVCERSLAGSHPLGVTVGSYSAVRLAKCACVGGFSVRGVA